MFTDEATPSAFLKQSTSTYSVNGVELNTSNILSGLASVEQFDDPSVYLEYLDDYAALSNEHATFDKKWASLGLSGSDNLEQFHRAEESLVRDYRQYLSQQLAA